MTELKERKKGETNHGFESENENGITSYNEKAIEIIDDVDNGEGVKLKRDVGLLGAFSYVVGSMIGSGIFVSPKGVLASTESVGMSLVIWVACGIIAMLG